MGRVVVPLGRLWDREDRGVGGLRWERVRFDGGYDTLLFRTVPKLLSELRDTYNRVTGDNSPSEGALLHSYVSVDLLLLDDIGAEQVKNTGWVEDRLYQVIGERHDEMKDIVFTSNLNLDQLAERIGERIVWRIVEMCGKEHIVEVRGPNLRDL